MPESIGPITEMRKHKKGAADHPVCHPVHELLARAGIVAVRKKNRNSRVNSIIDEFDFLLAKLD